MILLETIKRVAEKVTGWRRPDKPRSRTQAQTFRFKDDGLVPNHPRWPLIIYKGDVRLAPGLDPATVFEELFDSHGWDVRGAMASMTMLIIIHASTKPSVSREAAGRCDSAGQTGAPSISGRAMSILPAGTGHQRIRASADFLVVGAYPASGAYGECKSEEDRKKALPSIDRVARRVRTPFTARPVL